MPDTKSDETPAARVYTCDFCGATFGSRQGRNKHKRVCEYRPDADDDDGEGLPAPGGAGVDIYGSDESEDSGGDIEDDIYQCPDCGYSAKRAFVRCPTCAADLEW